jgi:DNA modification methylase
MACRELGRQFTGIDLDSHYCEIAERRIAATQEDKAETLFE